MGCLILNTLGSFKLSVPIHQLQNILEYDMSFCVVCTVINIRNYIEYVKIRSSYETTLLEN